MNIISEKTFEKARKVIKLSKAPIIFTSNDDDLNRKILEKEKIDILLINQIGRKDYSKQRNSGFNQVLAKIAQKNKVLIGINLDEIINSSGKIKAEILARIKQNVKICNKNKLKMTFISKNKQNEYNLRALSLSLGMPTFMFNFFN